MVSVLGLLGFFGLLLKKLWQEKHPTALLMVLLLLGLAVRAVWIGVTQPAPQSDFAVYWDYANRIYHGNLNYDVIERHPGIILLYTMSFYLLGPSLLSGWVCNLFFSGLFLLLVYKLAQECFGQRVGLLAMGICALLPQAITYSALMASEIPGLVFFLMIIWAVLQTRSIEKFKLPYWAGIGLLLYGATLVRSTSLLLLVLIPVAIVIARRDQWKPALQGALVMWMTAGVLLSTWITHQYLITGQLKLLYGDELWLAYATQYDKGGSVWESGMPFEAQFTKAQDGTMQGKLKSYKVLKEEALKVIQADPVKYLQFGFVRMQQILWGSKTGILWTTKASSIFPSNPKLIRRLSEVSTHMWRILLVLAFVGLLILPRSKELGSREGHVLIGLFVVCWLLFHYLIAVASERYAFQMIPFVAMLSAVVLSWVLERLKIWRTELSSSKVLCSAPPLD